jgi:hypothetical protein
VATGEITRVRQTLLRLADTLAEAGPEKVMQVSSGDDELCVTLSELCVTLSEMSAEDVYDLASRCCGSSLRAWRTFEPRLGWYVS